MTKKPYTWGMLNTDVAVLYNQITESKWQPSSVVGLIRGGCVPGVMLSHKFDVPFEALHWSKRDFAHQSFGHYINHILKHAIRMNERILIVDDILDSGETIADLQYYASKMASVKFWSLYIKFAVLIENTDSQVHVDYSANKISRAVDKDWIEFAWEKHD